MVFVATKIIRNSKNKVVLTFTLSIAVKWCQRKKLMAYDEETSVCVIKMDSG